MYHDCFCKKRLNAPFGDPNERVKISFGLA